MHIDNIIEVFKNFNAHTDDYLGAMYIAIYHELPRCYRMYYDNENLTYIDAVDNFFEARKNISTKVDCRGLLKNLIKVKEKYGLNIFCFSPHEYIILGDSTFSGQPGDLYNSKNFLINITLSEDSSMANMYEEVFCTEENIEFVFNFLKPYFVATQKDSEISFGITAIDATNNLYTSWYSYNKKDNNNIENNYNDDFPADKIYEIVEKTNSPELVLFYGEPGTGKTSFIKHLIFKYEETDFVFMDGALLAGVSQEKLMTYFLDHKDTVFILEDCEKALIDRENNYNPVMPVLLNITDGIIGDVLGIKLICTFNTSLNKIDKALLRKGRLSLKYEFKKLSKDKVSKILGYDVDKDMSLAEIYNINDENDFSKANSRKIGF